MQSMPREIAVRPAAVDDVPLIAKLVAELADYEKLTHAIDATPDMLREALFGQAPRVYADIATWNGEPAGFALWFYNFSTFRGRHGIFLEDIFVRPAFRSHGLGKALLKGLARRCADEKLARLEWVVLDWNTPAIEFYRS